ncbi:MAG: hypothetical protein R3F54_24120 [Alphaproteobacteria bacterium]
MIQAVVLLLRMLLFSLVSAAAVAEPPAPAIDLRIDGTLDPAGNARLIDAIIAMAPNQLAARQVDLAIEPAAAQLSDDDWADDHESGVAYALSGSVSVGLDYEHENIEDLTEQHIEMGTAGVDYTSHRVLVRAHVALDFVP